MSPERRLDPRSAQWVVQALARWTLTVAIILGVVITVGGPARWVGPAYATAMEVPGAPATWGVILGAAGAVGLAGSLTGRLKVVAVALYLVAVWAIFFGWSVLRSAWQNPHAGTTGVPIYAFAAVVAGTLAVVHWRSAP